MIKHSLVINKNFQNIIIPIYREIGQSIEFFFKLEFWLESDQNRRLAL